MVMKRGDGELAMQQLQLGTGWAVPGATLILLGEEDGSSSVPAEILRIRSSETLCKWKKKNQTKQTTTKSQHHKTFLSGFCVKWELYKCLCGWEKGETAVLSVPKARCLYGECDLQGNPEGNGGEAITVIKYVTCSGIKGKCSILHYPLWTQESHHGLKLQEEIFQLNARKQLSKSLHFGSLRKSILFAQGSWSLTTCPEHPISTTPGAFLLENNH